MNMILEIPNTCEFAYERENRCVALLPVAVRGATGSSEGRNCTGRRPGCSCMGLLAD
eukprot:COSAG02_NODE_3545_length_6583_cov_2.896823_5_plen_57_part_00